MKSEEATIAYMSAGSISSSAKAVASAVANKVLQKVSMGAPEKDDDDTPDVNSLPNYVKEWLLLTEEIRVLSDAIKERKKRMGTLQGLITKTMKGNQIAQLKTKSGDVVYQKKSSKESLTKKFIINHLTEFFQGDAVKAMEIYNFLESKRATKEKENIKLEKP